MLTLINKKADMKNKPIKKIIDTNDPIYLYNMILCPACGQLYHMNYGHICEPELVKIKTKKKK